MFSANCYADKEYCVGYAVSDSPMGPFVKPPQNPILSQKGDIVTGPGHNSAFQVGNQWICAYHVHTDPAVGGGNRQLFLDKISFDGDRMVVEGPTLGQTITIPDPGPRK